MICEHENPTDDIFHQRISPKREPAVLRNLDIGEDWKNWTSEYLANKIGDVPVKIHVSPVPQMDFLKKNFLYKTLPFNEFITRSKQATQKEFFMSSTEKYYLRSIAVSNPRKGVANIEHDFPAIANDVKLPSFVPKEKIFSSVFRIASADLQLWTHYDVMDNILVQLIGRKRIILFSPKDALNLYLNGDKSEVIDIDSPNLQKFPKFQNTVKYECVLNPGDAIFIPAMWFHNVIALDFSVGINVFYKTLDDTFYDQKDIYGNKDLIPASRAMQMLEKATKVLESLPSEYRDFYLRLMISKIQKSNDFVTDN